MAHYKVWDSDSGNLLGVYPNEDSALAMIYAGVVEDGPSLWQRVGLLKMGDSEGEDQLIAEGEAPIALTNPLIPVQRT